MIAQQMPKLLTLLAMLLCTACDTGVVVADRANQTSTTELTADLIAEFENGANAACIDSNLGVIVCPASDMARVTRTGPVDYEHPDLDWSNGALQLHAARNETVAFQLLLRTSNAITTDDVIVELEQVQSAANSANTAAQNTNTQSPSTEDTNTQWFNQSMFTAFYHPIDNAGYTWGPPTTVLPWPDEYPDALVPSKNACQSSTSDDDILRIDVPTAARTNQAVWVDTYVSKDTAPGTYSQNINLSVGENSVSLPIQITVYDASLPDEPSIDAVGELYRSYFLEGVGYDITQPQWQKMSQCYQQLAHQHRMVFIERLPDQLTPEQLVSYADTIEPAMTGELFTTENGYTGPGENTPVTVWKTPWPQTFDGVNYTEITDREINRYEGLARTWNELVIARDWTQIDFFSYVFDEMDGPSNNGNGSLPRDQYLAVVHEQFAQVQAAIDRGSESNNIDLLWTSHSNPTIWQDDPVLDLTDTVRLWAPNASAADTDFLQQRVQAGEKAWFYHSGHPAVGAHSINVSGIEMRTWGVIGARYGLNGQFMWAVNLGSDEFPYRDPQFNPDEDRAGNGVLVYPGNQLDKIGRENSPGPVPSMRLKSWRRGLQDAELYFIARDQSPTEAEALIKQQIPSALTQGSGAASWSSDSTDWIDFHRQLLELASQR